MPFVYFTSDSFIYEYTVFMEAKKTFINFPQFIRVRICIKEIKLN